MILEKLQTLIADQLGVDGNSITMDTNFGKIWAWILWISWSCLWPWKRNLTLAR